MPTIKMCYGKKWTVGQWVVPQAPAERVIYLLMGKCVSPIMPSLFPFKNIVLEMFNFVSFMCSLWKVGNRVVWQKVISLTLLHAPSPSVPYLEINNVNYLVCFFQVFSTQTKMYVNICMLRLFYALLYFFNLNGFIN